MDGIGGVLDLGVEFLVDSIKRSTIRDRVVMLEDALASVRRLLSASHTVLRLGFWRSKGYARKHFAMRRPLWIFAVSRVQPCGAWPGGIQGPDWSPLAHNVNSQRNTGWWLP